MFNVLLRTWFLNFPVRSPVVLPYPHTLPKFVDHQELRQCLIVVRDITMSRFVAQALVAPNSVWQLPRDIPEGRPQTTRGCHEEGTRKKVSTNGVFISEPPDEGFRAARTENHR